MKKILTGALAALLCMTLLFSAALADALSLDGTVIPGESVPVYAPIGGTVAEVCAEPGQQIAADGVLYTMKTEKVYANADGTVTGIFGMPGDSTETVAEHYGAVMYLEETAVYSVSATTDNAYNSTETKFVHAGEPVWLLCRSSSARFGQGVITAVTGTSYTVRVDSGTFIPGDSVDVYRDEAHTNTKKIGRGTVSRVDPTAVTASGAIVRIAVENGAQVKRGDLLLETLEGSFDGLYMSGTEITAGTDGVVGSLNVTRGGSVQKGSIAAEIYRPGSMRAEAYVPEDSRNLIREGDAVTIELEADESRKYPGTVALVSFVAEGEGEEATYRVLADFTPDDAVQIGMGVVITTGGEAAPEEAEETENAEGAGEAEPAEDAGGEQERRERPEGRNRKDGTGRPEGLPEMPEGGFPAEGDGTDDAQP